jgi:hypothetical protein
MFSDNILLSENKVFDNIMLSADNMLLPDSTMLLAYNMLSYNILL